MTNFGADLTKLAFKVLSPDISNLSPGVQGILKPILDTIMHQATSLKQNLIEVHSHDLGQDTINTYGFGMSPYFISIALWAGALVMTFLFKNERHIKDKSTTRHYFGKSMAWVLTGWLQATILMTAVTLQGVDLGFAHQWELFLFGYFISAVFSMFIQAVSYAIRWGDIGEFTVVILLVVQLISSSGTFPVEMQHWIFKVFHPIVPFTYTIAGIREIFFDTDISILFFNMGILLLFPIIAIPISLYLNYRYDKRTRVEKNGKYEYESYEIHMGDL